MCTPGIAKKSSVIFFTGLYSSPISRAAGLMTAVMLAHPDPALSHTHVYVYKYILCLKTLNHSDQ